MSPIKKLPMERPTKPASGYNIYYQSATRRARKREEALRLFNEKVMRMPPNAQPGLLNKTKFIGGQWKTLIPFTRELYDIRSKDELELYHTSKVLWAVLDRILEPATPVEDQMIANAKQGGKKKNKKQKEAQALRDEMQRHLCLFLM